MDRGMCHTTDIFLLFIVTLPFNLWREVVALPSISAQRHAREQPTVIVAHATSATVPFFVIASAHSHTFHTMALSPDELSLTDDGARMLTYRRHIPRARYIDKCRSTAARLRPPSHVWKKFISDQYIMTTTLESLMLGWDRLVLGRPLMRY